MDETAIAFELPHARASATHSGPPLDRISVRDYVRDVEVGAFRSERGVSQRIRFNIVLEVSHHAAAGADDVDQVVSYDSITEAIEAAIEADRADLLETLAERVAQGCLADPRAVRVFVRLEKLDRIPGALGVEIVRSRAGAMPRLRPVAPPAAGATPRTAVVYLPRHVLDGPDGPAWRDALAAWPGSFVLVLDPAAPQPPAASEAQFRIGLLAIEQSAWGLVGSDPRFSIAAARTELDWALKTGRRSVWAPARMATTARPADEAATVPDASDPARLADWLAAEIGAARLVVVGAPLPDAPRSPATAIAAERPEDFAALTLEEKR